MIILRRLAHCVAALLLGALSLRFGLLPLPLALLGVVGLAALAFVPRRGAQHALAAILAAGTLGWLGVLGLRVSERMALGLPMLRLALILGAVAAFTAWTAWLAWRAGRDLQGRPGPDA